MKSYILYTGIFLLLSVSSFAQDKEIKPGKPNELDKQYTPDKNSSNPSNGSSSSSAGYAGKSNFVKFNFALLARSTFAFFYERKITDGISLQGGLGYCYDKDKAQTFLTEGEDVYFSENKSALSLGRIQYNGSFKSGGPFLSASARFAYNGLYSSWFYANDDRNSYIELGVRYYTHRYSYTSTNTAYEKIEGGSNIPVRNLCYMITWGYQIETDSRIVTSHEFYTGFGLRRSKYNVFTSSYDQQNYTTYTKTSMKETAVSPMFTIGYVLGFGF